MDSGVSQIPERGKCQQMSIDNQNSVSRSWKLSAERDKYLCLTFMGTMPDIDQINKTLP